jgi:hypothetical protein
MMIEPQFEFSMPDSNNPIDALEAIAKENKWPLEKISDEEASLECEGRWGQFTLSFMWQEEYQALLFCCTSNLSVPMEKLNTVKELLCDINHKTWLGHFDVTDEERNVFFRYTSLMRGFSANGQDHIEDLIELAMTEFDRFYPAFKAVMGERRVANDVMMTMLADPMGEA